MSTMIGLPVEVLPYVRGVQLVLVGYSGYSKDSRIKVDKMVRNEIVRAAGRVRNHMQIILESQYREGNLSLALKAKTCIDECDLLIEDVNKSVSGMQHAFLSGQKSPTKGELKRLIKHDHNVIDMVTKAVNLANSAEQSIAANDGNNRKLLLHTIQLVTSCRGFFRARANILAGLNQKKKRK